MTDGSRGALGSLLLVPVPKHPAQEKCTVYPTGVAPCQAIAQRQCLRPFCVAPVGPKGRNACPPLMAEKLHYGITYCINRVITKP